jgi:hypothetical protein
MLAELLVIVGLVVFLLRFPRMLFQTWASGRYAGIGGLGKPKVRTGPGLLESVIGLTGPGWSVSAAEFSVRDSLRSIASSSPEQAGRPPRFPQSIHDPSETLRAWWKRWPERWHDRQSPPPSHDDLFTTSDQRIDNPPDDDFWKLQ